MRKLILTRFKFQTGENEYEDYTLVVVNQEPNDVEGDLLKKAGEQFIEWFPTQYPESELLSVVPKATIGAEPELI